MHGRLFNLDSAVGSRKSTQAIGAPGKPEKPLITNKVTTSFSDSPGTPIAYASFSRPTAESRFNHHTILRGWLLGTALLPALTLALTPDIRTPIALAPYALSTDDLSISGGGTAYRPWLENGSWQGDLIEYTLVSGGQHQTDVDFSSTPPVANGNNWSARSTFAAREGADAFYWKTGRQIITSTTGRDQVAFRWDSLSDAQRLALDPGIVTSGGAQSAYVSAMLNYVRGLRDGEGGSGFRVRQSLLGAITHANPVYVGAPQGHYHLPGYADFRNAYTNRAPRVYVGANDGMLHAFDAQDGHEVFAYIPSQVIPALPRLSDVPYLPTRYVDGKLTVADAVLGTQWQTILASGLGAGGKGLFILNITDPDLSNETSTTTADRKVVREISAQDSDDIGYIYGRPRIAKLPDGQWYVIAGNGYGSVSGNARLLLIRLSDGSLTTMRTLSGGGNGLSAPTLVDSDQDDIADFAYAGDLKGNLWRFDLAHPSYTASKLFSADLRKPITVSPEVGRHPQGGFLIYFGTGRLLEAQDKNLSDTQSIYAIWDAATQPIDETQDLLAQTFSTTTDAQGTLLRVVSDEPMDYSQHKGWKIDLPGPGERLLGAPQLRDGRLQLVTTEVSETSARHWLIEVDWLSGGASAKPTFDVDLNGLLDNHDSIGTPSQFPAGLDLGYGSYSQPTIARVRSGSDLLLINGLAFDTPPEPCTGDCVGGIKGGHFDLDMDTSLGGKTDGHVHEYDDKYGVTYADYFNLFGGLNSADAVGIDPNLPMVALIANADLSPGGVLTIGNKSWNVVAYQKMIHAKLPGWDGVSALLDNDGDPLTFSLADLKNSGGMLQLSFDDQAIYSGGLIATNTGCVNGSASITNDRWRNGALTLQLVDASGAASYRLSTQYPPDLVKDFTINGQHLTLNDGEGGLRSNMDITPNGFLYESTVFWHYPGKACYGDEGWVNEVQTVLADIRLQAVQDSGSGSTPPPDGSTTGSGLADIPLPPTDTDQAFSVMGPAFRTGRRAWIDLIQ